MCRMLEVSKSGYYSWLKHEEKQDEHTSEVVCIFETHKKRYGVRRIRAELRASNKAVGYRRVRRIMKEEGLVAIAPRSFVPRTTNSNHNRRMSPNLLLERAIKVDRPKQVIVGDITYLPLLVGKWAYLAT